MELSISASGEWSANRLLIGRSGENDYREVTILPSEWGKEYPGATYALIYRRPDGVTYPVEVSASPGRITWRVQSADVAAPGYGGCLELRLMDGDTIGKTAMLACAVVSSLDASTPPPTPEPDWIGRVVDAAGTATESAEAAGESAARAESAAGNAAESAVAADGHATQAGLSAERAEDKANDAGKSETDAAISKAAAQQALSDLLAMMGSDIATLVGGKIPLTQIPATATQEIYTVTSADELTGLTAQRGDLAELIEDVDGDPTIVKVWQCLGDAAMRDNWVVWGTSYAVQAGNAAMATEAGNAQKINNKRMIAMTQEQYDIAVKDADTLYVVTPDGV